MRSPVLAMIFAGACGSGDENDCSSPVRVTGDNADVAILHDEAGLPVDERAIQEGKPVELRLPGCAGMLTISRPGQTLTLQGVRPGDEIDFADQVPDVPRRTVVVSAPGGFEMSVGGPGCVISSSGAGSCPATTKKVLAYRLEHGFRTGYAVVTLAREGEMLVGTAGSWREDLASMQVTLDDQHASVRAEIALVDGGGAYDRIAGDAPGVIGGIAQFGDAVVHILREDGELEDTVIERLEGVPEMHEIALFAGPKVITRTLGDGIVSWQGDPRGANFVVGCARYTQPFNEWCVVAPIADSVVFPTLPERYAPSTLPANSSVMLVETSEDMSAPYHALRNATHTSRVGPAPLHL